MIQVAWIWDPGWDPPHQELPLHLDPHFPFFHPHKLLQSRYPSGNPASGSVITGTCAGPTPNFDNKLLLERVLFLANSNILSLHGQTTIPEIPNFSMKNKLMQFPVCSARLHLCHLPSHLGIPDLPSTLTSHMSQQPHPGRIPSFSHQTRRHILWENDALRWRFHSQKIPAWKRNNTNIFHHSAAFFQSWI